MTHNEALNILIQAVDKGRQEGIYTFKDCVLINEAIETWASLGRGHQHEDNSQLINESTNDVGVDTPT